MGIGTPASAGILACFMLGRESATGQARCPPGNQRLILAKLSNQTHSFHRVTIKHDEMRREVRRLITVTKIYDRHLTALDALRRAKNAIT